MDIAGWVEQQGGIAHRWVARDAGYDAKAVRAAARAGRIEVVNRYWLVTTRADADARRAVALGGRVACISAARARGWWLPPTIDERLHVAVPTNAGRITGDDRVVLHWNRPVVPVPRGSTHESVEDVLAHVASCLRPADAIIVWESALRRERLDVVAIRRVGWPTDAARHLADLVTGLSDSGLETILLRGLVHLPCTLRPQALVAGHRVDLLIGERLVIQVDGYEFHSGSAERSRDIAHDAELTLRGYTVLRFSYAQIVHDWASVERTISRAVAAGLHR